MKLLDKAEKKNIHNTPPSKENAIEEENSDAYGAGTDKTDKRVPETEAGEAEREIEEGMAERIAKAEVFRTPRRTPR